MADTKTGQDTTITPRADYRRRHSSDWVFSRCSQKVVKAYRGRLRSHPQNGAEHSVPQTPAHASTPADASPFASFGLSYSIALYVVAMLSKLVWGTVYLARGDLWREMRSDLVA